MMRSMRVAVVLATICAVTAAPLGAADFVRGDVNRDRRVTIADAGLLMIYMFQGLPEGDAFDRCQAAGDVDGNLVIDISDAFYLMRHVVDGSFDPVAPFPDPGPVAEEEELGCEDYGLVPPLEDSGAALRILDATAAGGQSGLALVTLATSASDPIAAVYAEIEQPSGMFAEVTQGNQGGFRQLWSQDCEGADYRSIAMLALPEEDRLEMAVTYIGLRCESGYRPPQIPAGTDLPAFEIAVCLAPGTPAGEYPLNLVGGEFTDPMTGRAIEPQLIGGTLTVLSDVDLEGTECELDPPPPPPPPVVTFALADGTAAQGESVDLPFSIEANVPSQGFTFSVDFDEEVLDATNILRLWNRPGGTPFEFIAFDMDNENRFPGNQGVNEGYVTGAAIISLTDSEDVLPPGEIVEVLSCEFVVHVDAPIGETEIRFVDGGIGRDGFPVSNKLIAGGQEFTAETADAFLFIPGTLEIVPPDGIPFLRGDSTANLDVDISDPIHTLSVLYLGVGRILCEDAADADDSGLVDVTDPIFTLEALFLGTHEIPAPYPRPGNDPTPDDPLGCLGGS